MDDPNTIILIPARMASIRLPGKPLAEIDGVPMIVQVMRRGLEANIGDVVVAASEQEIVAAVEHAGGKAILTDPDLASGSDRIAAALQMCDPDGAIDYVINLQGDLPMIAPEAIRACHTALMESGADIATLVAPITDPGEIADPNVVKAMVRFAPNTKLALAQDFARILPAEWNGGHFHHIGIYAYRRAALVKFVSLPVSARERAEKLEQLRALDAGLTIAIARVDTIPLGVDTPADLEQARKAFAASPFTS
jgi:3-deoxy-manno-octulosonate cytidylyltransferase (CMP-KDO synthetase)